MFIRYMLHFVNICLTIVCALYCTSLYCCIITDCFVCCCGGCQRRIWGKYFI